MIAPGTSLPAALLLPLLAVPLRPFLRPALRASADATAIALLAGLLAGQGTVLRAEGGCLLRLPDRTAFDAVGWFEAPPRAGGGSIPFRIIGGVPDGCTGTVRAVPPAGSGAVTAGRPGRWRAQWRASRRAGPVGGGISAGGTLFLGGALGPVVDVRAPLLLRARARTQATIAGLFGEHAGVVDALILARKENLDPETREAFAAAGLAHLLAISGFHVAVIASLLFGLLRAVGLPRPAAGAAAVATVWIYVLAIGVPDAALRATIILSVVAIARGRGRRAHAPGVLGTAALAILLVDPGALGRIGFQLSFAGAFGLAILARPLAGFIRGRVPAPIPGGVVLMLAAGIAASVTTLPLVAWHFDRVPTFGVLSTLIAGPVVAIALPGILGALVLSPLAPAAAAFLAGGVSVLLDLLLWVARFTAALPGASPWTSRTTVVTAAAAVLAGSALARAARVRGVTRHLMLPASATVGALVAPLMAGGLGGGTLLLTVIDVGQGDAIALRSPAGRWVLVDAGPATPRWDAGSRVVVPFFRQAGTGRIEALVLTHPDLDHIGGAPAVLTQLDVGAVIDPGLAAGRDPFVGALVAAEGAGVPWHAAGAVGRLDLDGVEIRVLSPRPGGLRDATSGPSELPAAIPEDANDASVVILVRFGQFRALLTGDAPSAVEERLIPDLTRVQVLKVGHHGSRTSSSSAFLDAVDPEVGLIPVGRDNRYGHPAPAVVRRLDARGIELFRTDMEGTIEVRARSDGSYTVRTTR